MNYPKVYSLTVRYSWGTAFLGYYTAEEIWFFLQEYIGPPDTVSIEDPILIDGFLAV